MENQGNIGVFGIEIHMAVSVSVFANCSPWSAVIQVTDALSALFFQVAIEHFNMIIRIAYLFIVSIDALGCPFPRSDLN